TKAFPDTLIPASVGFRARRGEFIALVGRLPFAWPLPKHAQQPDAELACARVPTSRGPPLQLLYKDCNDVVEPRRQRACSAWRSLAAGVRSYDASVIIRLPRTVAEDTL